MLERFERPAPGAVRHRAPRAGQDDAPVLPRRTVPVPADPEEARGPLQAGDGQVRIHSGSSTQEAALQEATDILVTAGAVTPAYADAMRQREETVSTYMGNGLAIPHGTNDAKDAILGSALSVVRYDGGVD